MRALIVLMLGALSLTAAAQNLFDFDDWMQRIDDGSQDLQRHIAARDARGCERYRAGNRRAVRTDGKVLRETWQRG
jgi:hypothetical protein